MSDHIDMSEAPLDYPAGMERIEALEARMSMLEKTLLATLELFSITMTSMKDTAVKDAVMLSLRLAKEQSEGKEL